MFDLKIVQPLSNETFRKKYHRELYLSLVRVEVLSLVGVEFLSRLGVEVLGYSLDDVGVEHLEKL